MISPHGGVLVNRCLLESKQQAYAKAPGIPMSAIAASDFWNIATGVFSPLTGFMDEKTIATVLNENRIESLAWTIPITLDVTAQVAETVKPGREMALTDRAGAVRGVIQVREMFRHQKDERCRGTFGTTERRHPGVATVQAMGDYLVAGDVWAFPSGGSEREAIEEAGKGPSASGY